MKKLSKRFIISVLTLVLTVVALGTSTFAWFSLSTVSKVTNIGGNVTAGDSLQIQLSGTKAGTSAETIETAWMSNIDEATFITKLAAGLKFDAVTTANGYADFTKMGTNDNGNIYLGNNAVANIDYLEFTINFRSQVAGTVNLTELEFAGGAEAIFKPDSSEYIQVPEKDASKLPVTTHAAYGARASFQTGVSTAVAYQMPNTDNELSFVMEGDPEKAVSVKGNHTSGEHPVVGGQWSYLTTGLGLEIYDSVNGTTKLAGSSLTSISLVEAKTVVSTTSESSTTYTTSVNLTKVDNDAAYFTGRMTVRIWIEGWDVDSYDSIYNLPLVVNMKFEKFPA